MPFQFKQFSIDDSGCAMKVGTDSVLLGAWIDFKGSLQILDIGTGSGLLALMAAQESKAVITAIDIDEACYLQAIDNFNACPWSDRLKCMHSSLGEFTNAFLQQDPSEIPLVIAPEVDFLNINLHNGVDGLYDHIISNPPWFTKSLKSGDYSRNRARHNDDLPPEEMIRCVTKLLADGGRYSLVLPFSDKEYLVTLAKASGLFPSRETIIIPRSGKAPNRCLLEFTKGIRSELNVSTLTIRDAEGNYTPEYQKLTGRFYLNF